MTFLLFHDGYQGSSAIQIVPSIQPKAAKVANFVRGKTCRSLSSMPYRHFLDLRVTQLWPTKSNLLITTQGSLDHLQPTKFKSAILEERTVSHAFRINKIFLADSVKLDHFTQAEHREFDDPVLYAQFRHRIEEELNVCWPSDHLNSLQSHRC